MFIEFEHSFDCVVKVGFELPGVLLICIRVIGFTIGAWTYWLVACLTVCFAVGCVLIVFVGVSYSCVGR